MDHRGGGVAFSEENGLSGSPGLDFQGSWVPSTPVKPVPARRLAPEVDKELLWLSSLGISAVLYNPEISVQNADLAEASYSGPAGTSYRDQVRDLNAPSLDDAFWPSHAYASAAPGLGRNPHEASVACSFTDLCSVAKQISSNAVQSSLPATPYPQNNGGWLQRHHFSAAAHPLRNRVWQQNCFPETNTWCNGFLSQTHEYGFPVPYNKGAKASNSSTIEVLDAPVAPVTPEKILRKKGVVDGTASKPVGLCTLTELCTTERVHRAEQHNNAIPSKVAFVDAQNEPSVDQQITRGLVDCQQGVTDSPVKESIKVHQVMQHNSAIPSKVPFADSQNEPSAEQQNNRCLVDSQQSGTESSVKEIFVTEKANADGVDLNRTPPQKPKRKKIRPKVVREGKPRGTPKNHVKQTPEETLVQKRRRTTTGRRKSKDSTAITVDVGEPICLPNAARVASCKRSLNFDSDAQTCNVDARLQRDSDKFGQIQHHVVEKGRSTLENPTESVVFDFNGSSNHIFHWHVPLSENSSPSLLKRKASSKWNPKNMARNKNRTENGNVDEKHEGNYVNNRTLASMTGPSTLPVYDTSQQDERIISNASQSSSQTPTTCSSNMQAYPHKPTADAEPANSSKFPMFLVQAHLHAKHEWPLMDVHSHHNWQLFNKSFSNTKTEVSLQKHQPCMSSTTVALEDFAGETEVITGCGSVNTNPFTLQACNEVVLSASGSPAEKQKGAEPNNHVHNETSVTESEKQQSHTGQNYPGETYLFKNMQECKNMLVQIEVKRKRSPKKAPTHAHRPSAFFFSIDHSLMPQHCKQEKENRIACTPQACQEALLTDRLAQKITKKRTRKGISCTMKSVPRNTVDGHETCIDQGQESHGVLSSNLVNKHENLRKRTMHSVQDCQSSSNLQITLASAFPSQVVPIMKPIDEIVERLRCLEISEKYENAAAALQNAIVPFIANGTIVPYAGIFEPLRKQRPRPKVDLDEETNRVWKLLMGNESDGIDGSDADKEKWWEEERAVFRGRAQSFIARMHLVQGDRRFSQWKGSVVDSVVGVFLTQNVSDHLSSSAFMALAARFPLNEKTERATLRKNKIVTSSPVQEFSARDLNESEANLTNLPFRKSSELDRSSITIQDSKPREKILPDRTSHLELYETNTTGKKVNNIKIMHTNEYKASQDSSSSTKHFKSTVENERISTESEDGNLLCFAAIFSQHSTYSTTQAATRIGSSPECGTPAEEFINRGKKNCFQQRSFSELLYMAESPTFKDLYANKSHCGTNAEQAGGASGQLLHKKWKINLNKGSGAGPSLEIVNCPMISGTTKSSSIEATPFITTFAPEEHTISFPDEPTNADLLFKNSHKEHCWVKQGSLHSPSKVKHAVDADSSEHTKPVENQKRMENKLKASSKDEAIKNGNKSTNRIFRSNKGKGKGEALSTKDKWDPLRTHVVEKFDIKERAADKNDSLDWEAVRHADVNEVAQAIKERGMNNMLAARIQVFLNRLVEDHGSIDLEWLRHVPPDKTKDFLLSIKGLGLKSVECVRLLTLQHLAFPVDTNVGRICVRLGWVPLQPLPESLQLHLLELYPVLESIQKYLWPRLCKLDQRTLYELHYQLITFGKVFCTKSRPNCNACPMRGECKHFASAFASARLALPAPEEKSLVSSSVPIMAERETANVLVHPITLPPPMELPPAIECQTVQKDSGMSKCEPIIEEPATPEPESVESLESAIEDFNYEDPDEIPTIKLNIEELTLHVKNYMKDNMELQDSDISKALVALTPEAASIPIPKLKNVSRLRTEHQVYELPDDHPLLEGLDKREPDDPCFYLLAIWTPGETAESIEPPKACCGFQATGSLCDKQTCFSCNAVREENAQTVRGTLLIPCRTAMRGSFPLNGTYFQVNEVFADHESSLNPIAVPRALIWNLPRRTVYFGTSVTTIFKGLTTEEIQFCFWRGFVCVRGFDLKTRAPRPLMARFHFPASKQTRNKRTTARKLEERSAAENLHMSTY